MGSVEINFDTAHFDSEVFNSNAVTYLVKQLGRLVGHDACVFDSFDMTTVWQGRT